MAVYLVNCDINCEDEAEYQELREQLRQLGATKIRHSEWMLIGDFGEVRVLYRLLSPLIKSHDRLLVEEVMAYAKA